jgi:mannose-6-phosphate isomerase-like protein (cupin superfamily)
MRLGNFDGVVMTQATISANRYEAVPMQFSYAAQASATWYRSGSFKGFEERDLMLGQASAGQLIALELKAERAGQLDRWPQLDNAVFFLFYVLKGQAKFSMSDGKTVTLYPREAVHLPFLLGTRSVEWQEDLHVMQIIAQDRGRDLVPLLQMRSDAHSGDWEEVIVRNRPELFVRGDGPRVFFTYRDLGSAKSTERRIQTHDGDGAATDIDGGTGWHNHSMSQFFFILGGSADIDVENQGSFHLVPGDAMTLGREMRHNVLNIKSGYNVIEVCLPADYTTVPQNAPV